MSARIRVSCHKSNLALIREFVRGCLLDFRVQTDISNQIVLAVDEACANCMIHQHQCDGSATIEVNLYREADVVFAEIKDTGEAFPMDQYETGKELNQLISDRAKGGLGLTIIRSIMDEIKIEQNQDHFIYKLAKKMPPPFNGAK